MEAILMLPKTIALLKDLNKDGIKPHLWLRDDDICTDSPNLRLLLQAAKFNFPMVFAAVPYRLKFSDAELSYLESIPKNVRFCVHGFNHVNRSVDKSNSEYPAGLSKIKVMEELEYGVNKVRGIFEKRYLSMFVPPWNFIDASYISILDEVGFKMISGTESIALDVSGTSIQNLPSNIDILNYGPDIWHRIKDINLIDKELSENIINMTKKNVHDNTVCILSHHTSMISKDIATFKLIIENISEFFDPAIIRA
jgi:hypothetical protein